MRQALPLIHTTIATQLMTNADMASRLVLMLQQFRDKTSDDDWDALDGTPLGDALDALTDLEWELEDNDYTP